jgi:hypothetical protein
MRLDCLAYPMRESVEKCFMAEADQRYLERLEHAALTSKLTRLRKSALSRAEAAIGSNAEYILRKY